MPAIVALLRAVNLIGHNRIKMDVLRDLCVGLKLKDPRTYVQSGNIVFSSAKCDLDHLARRLEAAIEQTAGFRPDVILRTADQISQVIAKNPFANRTDVEPAKLAVFFLAGEPGPEACTKFLATKKGPEELRISGREAFVYYPDGMGRSKLTSNIVEKTLGTRGTARNWNTVRKLQEMLG